MDSFGMSCVKYLLFLFNLLFALSGIVILVVGILIQLKYNTYHQFIDEKHFSAPMILIVVGVIVFVVAFFGCCGAIKESNAMLITFGVLLGLIFIMEIAGGTTGYLLQDDIHGMLETRMAKLTEDYGKHQDITKSWDVLQSDLNCCGVKSGKDWEPVFQNTTLPHSCCPHLPIDNECVEDKASQVGCLTVLQTLLEKYTVVIGAVGIGVACVQLIGVIFACCLARSIRREYETV